jgi:hypothetical protein
MHECSGEGLPQYYQGKIRPAHDQLQEATSPAPDTTPRYLRNVHLAMECICRRMASRDVYRF